MRTSTALAAALLVLPLAVTRAQSNPCGKGCAIVFDWGNGGAAPDVDRIYGSPSTMEAEFTKVLRDAGWAMTTGTTDAAIVLTFRPVVQNRVRCEKMSGTNTDMSCHTMSRGTVMFASSDSTVEAPHRVEIVPRCSDPKAYPSFAEFGRFAGEWVVFQTAGGKGSRPSIKCRI
jgi:hypothetical protein